MTHTATQLSRILVVDDTEANRDMLSRRLTRRGYEVAVADGGFAALEQLARDEFDLILLDVMMPDLDGIKVLQTLRQQHSATDLPVIMATAKSQSEDMVEAFRAGANDYVTKPLDFPVVISRIETQLAVKHSVDEIQRLKFELEQSHAELAAAHHRVRRDLEAAAHVQRSLLPTDLPVIPGVQFAWAFEPCDQLGGDALNVIPLDDEHLGFFVLDVVGHGVAPALLAFTVSHLLSGDASHGSILKQSVPGTDLLNLIRPAKLAELLSRRFPFDSRTERYFTMFYGQLNVKTRELIYVSAGHPAPILLRRNRQPIQLSSPALPIGLEGLDYEDHHITLEPNDRLFIYSDGVTEAMNSRFELFGTENLIHWLQLGESKSLDSCLAGVQHALSEWAGEAGSQDDVTLLAIEVE